MKKLITIFGILISLISYSQDLTYTVNIADITTDTIISFAVPRNLAWNIQADFAGLTGTSGSFDVLQGNNSSNLNSWSSTTLPVTITAASTTTLAVTNNYMGGVYLAFKITKGTLTAGTATVTINYNDRK